MARVSLRRCSRSAKLSVGEGAAAAAGRDGAAGGEAVGDIGVFGISDIVLCGAGGGCAADAAVCLAGRMLAVDFVLAALESAVALADGVDIGVDEGTGAGVGTGAGAVSYTHL